MGGGRRSLSGYRTGKRCEGVTYSRAVSAWANGTPALRPEWDRGCARHAAVWPHDMVIFLKCMSEAEDAQLPVVLPLTWFLRSISGRTLAPSEFWPPWSLNAPLTIQLVSVARVNSGRQPTILVKNVVGPWHTQQYRQLRGFASQSLAHEAQYAAREHRAVDLFGGKVVVAPWIATLQEEELPSALKGRRLGCSPTKRVRLPTSSRPFPSCVPRTVSDHTSGPNFNIVGHCARRVPHPRSPIVEPDALINDAAN